MNQTQNTNSDFQDTLNYIFKMNEKEVFTTELHNLIEEIENTHLQIAKVPILINFIQYKLNELCDHMEVAQNLLKSSKLDNQDEQSLFIRGIFQQFCKKEYFSGIKEYMMSLLIENLLQIENLDENFLKNCFNSGISLNNQAGDKITSNNSNNINSNTAKANESTVMNYLENKVLEKEVNKNFIDNILVEEKKGTGGSNLNVNNSQNNIINNSNVISNANNSYDFTSNFNKFYGNQNEGSDSRSRRGKKVKNGSSSSATTNNIYNYYNYNTPNSVNYFNLNNSGNTNLNNNNFQNQNYTHSNFGNNLPQHQPCERRKERNNPPNSTHNVNNNLIVSNNYNHSFQNLHPQNNLNLNFTNCNNSSNNFNIQFPSNSIIDHPNNNLYTLCETQEVRYKLKIFYLDGADSYSQVCNIVSKQGLNFSSFLHCLKKKLGIYEHAKFKLVIVEKNKEEKEFLESVSQLKLDEVNELKIVPYNYEIGNVELFFNN